MNNLYTKWIKSNYPTPHSAIRQCSEATKLMTTEFTSLRQVKGHVFVAQNQRVEEHWWCEDFDGNVIDPTRHQWHGPVFDYTEFEGEEPIGKCYQCGKFIFKSKCKNEFFCINHQQLNINTELSKHLI